MKVIGFCRLVRDNKLELSKNGTYYCKNAIAWNDAKKQGHFLFLYRNIFLFYFWLHERYFQLRNIFRTIVQKVYK